MAMTRRVRKRHRIFAWGATLTVHAAILVLVLQAFPRPMQVFEPEAVSVELVPPPVPPPEPQPAPKPATAPPKASETRRPARQPPAARPIHLAVRRLTPQSLPTQQTPPVSAPDELSAADVAGAITAGYGSGSGGSGSGAGGACNMVRRLQEALRRDPRVLEAVEEAHRAAGGRGAAIMVWNGDWVRNGAEDGKGLASVRQAIAVDVAFAPAACRASPVSGLVLISLNDSPGAAKLALGAARWRWSDLLFAR
jgi:hypothetical protein